MKLTPANARDAAPGSTLKDHEVAGLALSCGAARPDGSCVKSWELYYRTRAGDRRRPTIGRFPEMTLSRAREVARELKDRVAKGEDPGAEWQARKEAPTVADLAERYLEEHANKKNSKRWAHEAELLVNRHILPGLGRMRVDDVRPQHVDDFLTDVRNRKYVPAKRQKQDGRATAPGAANMVRAVLSKMFSHAEAPLGWVQYDYGPRPKFPHPVRHAERNRMPKRKVTATPATLQRLAIVLDEMAAEHPIGYGPIVQRRHDRVKRIRPSMPVGLRRRRQIACIWTIFLTGSRVGEILRATTTELQDSGLQKSEHKTVRHVGDKTIPLPRRARELLAGLPPCDSGRLFGAIELDKVWKIIRHKIGQPELTLRDARRSWASYARSLGVPIDQVADVFGHTDVKTTHNNYQFMQDAAKAAVVERVAEHLLTVAGTPSTPKPRLRLKRARWHRKRAA